MKFIDHILNYVTPYLLQFVAELVLPSITYRALGDENIICL